MCVYRVSPLTNLSCNNTTKAPCRSDRAGQTRLSQIHHILRAGSMQTKLTQSLAESGHFGAFVTSLIHPKQVADLDSKTWGLDGSILLTSLVLSSYTPDPAKIRRQKAF